MLSSRSRAGKSEIDGLRMSGAIKALFPRSEQLEAIVINSSGGLTGGDRLEISCHAGAASHLTLTTQAAERCYRAQSGFARVTTELSAGPDATLFWLPQELILFDGSALRRRLNVELDPKARLLLAEPVIFGRAAMGEVVCAAEFRDEISVMRAGRPLYLDRLNLNRDIAARLARPAIANDARAMASVLYVAPDAEAHLGALRALMPDTGGVSLLSDDCLTIRFVAADGFELRRHLVPVLDRLSGNRLPRSWRL